jgi:hypothetical protein
MRAGACRTTEFQTRFQTSKSSYAHINALETMRALTYDTAQY